MNGITAFAFFCEDVRRESGGKITIIGMMQDTLQLPEIPGEIRRLTVYARIRLDVDKTFDKPISLEMEVSDGSISNETKEPIPPDLLERTIKRAKQRGLPYATIVGRVELQEPLRIGSPLKMFAVLKYGEERTTCGILNLIEAPKKDASTSS
jgi:hypothetical protein